MIENDWPEAIVALPDQLFYNTGISTYIWMVTNRKITERKRKVQLINATGTGKEDMIQRLQAYGLPEPQFVQAQYFTVTVFRTPEHSGQSNPTGELTPQDVATIKKVVLVLEGEMKRQQIEDALQIKHNDYFRVEYISPTLEHKYIELITMMIRIERIRQKPTGRRYPLHHAKNNRLPVRILRKTGRNTCLNDQEPPDRCFYNNN